MNEHLIDGVEMKDTRSTRRELLRSMGIGGAALAGANLLAQTKAAPGKGDRRIDVHHHMMPSFVDLWASRKWSPDASIEAMDMFGTETAILSVTGLQPIFADLFYDGSDKAHKLVRQCNDFGAKTAGNNRKRFGFFGCLPLPDVDLSLKEIEYVMDTQKADGIALFSNTGDRWLGDPLFKPVMQELNRRKAVVFIHPSVARCCRGLIPGVGDTTVEFDFDTTRTVGSLLYNGVLGELPDIKFIINHSGAAVPALSGRMKDQVRGQQGKSIPGGAEGAWEELRKLYFECAHATFEAPIAAVMKLAPTTQLLFGTDFPVWSYDTTTSHIPDLKLPADVAHAMDRGNAEKLFPRLKS